MLSKLGGEIRFFYVDCKRMFKSFYFGAALIVFYALAALSFRALPQKAGAARNPQRIVSLAPTITETLFALGLGDRVAGLTQFCVFPPEAQARPKVGGFREVNLEAIARTKADLVIMPADMAHFKKLVEDLGIPVLLFKSNSLENYLEDARQLGEITGKQKEAKVLHDNFMKHIKHKKNENAPEILFVISNPGEYDRPLTEMTIIGADEFYNGLIEAAGGQNAYRGATPFPRVSLEAVIAMNPDIIVVSAPGLRDIAVLENKWHEIGHLRGAQAGRLLILSDPGDTIPGPRSLNTLKKLENTIRALSR